MDTATTTAAPNATLTENIAAANEAAYISTRYPVGSIDSILNAPTVKSRKYTRAWWKDVGDRVISTTAQTFLSTFGVGVLFPNLIHVDLPSVGAISLTAGVLSFIKALAVANNA